MTPQTKQMQYHFEEITNCEMCFDKISQHVVLGQRLNQSQGKSPKSKTGVSVSVVKCENCGLIYCQPMPIPFDIQDHYGLPPEDYWPENYLEWDANYRLTEIEIVKTLLPFSNNMTALDVGTGIGKCMLSLKEAGFSVYGFEPSKPFFDRAISKMGIAKDRLKLGMIEEVDYPENSFDFISLGAVLEHFYHPSKSLEKVLKWLKPNGIIWIEVPSSNHFISKIFNLYYKLRGTNYVTHLSPMHSPFHLYEFTLKSFEKNGLKLGYTVAKNYYHHYDALNFPKILHPVLKKYMHWTKTGMQLTVYLRKNS